MVEDDDGIRETVKYRLVEAGYKVMEASDGQTALRTAHSGRPDLILLDLMLPGIDGLELCRLIRQSSRVPIIMVTARDAEVDRVVGLELGADDYVTKPFSVRELLARVSAVLRRSKGEPTQDTSPELETVGSFTIDRAARRVLIDGEDLKLTTREFDLLSFLIAHPGRVHARPVLLNKVWGESFSGDDKTVDVHIRWLRKKLENRVPFEIVTVRGAGYRLDKRPETPA